MQRFGRPLISILGSKSGPIICAIVLIAGLEKGSPARAQSVATRTAFTDSIKEPANVTVNGAVNKNAPTVVRSQLTDAEAQATIDFSIALKMRNFAELQQRVGMGEIIPLEEMEVKYFPASTDVESVRQWLIAQGFEALPAARYELSVFARGTVAQLQRVFGVTFARVQFRGEEHTSAVTAPSLPADVARPVLSINGLQPHLHPFSHAVRKAAAPVKSVVNQPPYLVSEIAGAYDASIGNGAGQKIGIVIDTFPKNSDLTTFWAGDGVPQSLSNIEKVQVVSGTLPAPEGEETLDASWSSGLASGAKIRIYATKDLFTNHLDQAYQFIINELGGRPSLHQLSMSFGLAENLMDPGEMQTDAQFFATLAARGVTIFVSSGDGGSNPDFSPTGDGSYNPSQPLEVEHPACDPSVTAVGGTSLSLNPPTGAVSSETVWFEGSGGGQSKVFSRPTWQPGSGTISGSGRLVPDVAFDADPNTGVVLVLNGQAYQFGGTSLGAPAWAGLCARINQVRASHGSTSLGLLGPHIYQFLQSSGFGDITSGTNGAYNAGSGFDLCTGIGVPDLNRLSLLLGYTKGSGVAKDVNGDGTADLVWENTTTGQRVVWLLQNGSEQAYSYLPTISTDWHIAAVGDFLGNGQSDLVWENTSTGQRTIWFMANGVLQSSISLPTMATQWSIVGAGDFNGDGQADLVWENATTGQRAIWFLKNGYLQSAIYLPTVSTDWHIAGVGDFNGNHHPDLVWEDTVTGQRAVWFMMYTALQSAVYLPTVSTDWHIAGAGDFNHSGYADLVWENTSTGQRTIWFMVNGTLQSTLNLPTVSTDWHIVDH